MIHTTQVNILTNGTNIYFMYYKKVIKNTKISFIMFDSTLNIYLNRYQEHFQPVSCQGSQLFWCFVVFCRSSPPEVLSKASGLRLATLFKKRLRHRCFPVDFTKFSRTSFFIEHLRRLRLASLAFEYKLNINVKWGEFYEPFKRQPHKMV